MLQGVLTYVKLTLHLKVINAILEQTRDGGFFDVLKETGFLKTRL